jgi:hypothetical protein
LRYLAFGCETSQFRMSVGWGRTIGIIAAPTVFLERQDVARALAEFFLPRCIEGWPAYLCHLTSPGGRQLVQLLRELGHVTLRMRI